MQGNMEIYDSQMDFIFAFEFAFPGTRPEKVYKGAKFKIQTQSPLGWLHQRDFFYVLLVKLKTTYLIVGTPV